MATNKTNEQKPTTVSFSLSLSQHQMSDTLTIPIMTKSNPAVLVLLFAVIGVLTTLVRAGDDLATFEAAGRATSVQCQDRSAQCLGISAGAQALFNAGRYCDLMEYNEDNVLSTQSCTVITGGCTQEEFNAVRSAVCGAATLSVSLASAVLAVFAAMLGKYM